MTVNEADPDPMEVHVWAVWLSASEAGIQTLRSLLSPEENAQEARFRFEYLRQAFALSHGALRLLLALYLESPAREIQFAFGLNGKPALLDTANLRFNMSHSGSLALYALASGCEIGVDVEELREIPDVEQIAAVYFSREETSELLSLSGKKAQYEAFFRCWTRKEAYIKAVGGGLSMPLDRFRVSLLQEEPARLIHIGDDVQAASEWVLEHTEPASGYVGAVAYRGRRRPMRFHGPIDCDELLETTVAALRPADAARD